MPIAKKLWSECVDYVHCKYIAIFKMVWIKTITVLAVVDVLLAAVLITVYVSLLSDHLPELQLIQGSKSYHLSVYLYVAVCTLVQLFVAFKLYQVLTLPKDDRDDFEDILRITRIWIIASYLLLFNWVLKAGIYAQRCNCGISVALATYLVEIIFRMISICVGSTFMKKMEKCNHEMKAQMKMRSVVTSLKLKKLKLARRVNYMDQNKFNRPLDV